MRSLRTAARPLRPAGAGPTLRRIAAVTTRPAGCSLFKLLRAPAKQRLLYRGLVVVAGVSASTRRGDAGSWCACEPTGRRRSGMSLRSCPKSPQVPFRQHGNSARYGTRWPQRMSR